MAKPATNASIRGVDFDEYANVDKATAHLRDMYGGAVRLEVCWMDDGCSGMTAITLDAAGVRQLADALLTALDASECDYQEARDAA